MYQEGTRHMEKVAKAMRAHGAQRIVFKLLANNDNSKQQIYFGGDFEVVRLIPHGELSGGLSERDGAIFKAMVPLYWMPPDLVGSPAPALGTQLIFYPKYPEVRLSGFLNRCAHAPSLLMRPPTPEERVARQGFQRCLILGICPDEPRVLAFVSSWQSALSREAADLIAAGARNVASVFFEFSTTRADTRGMLVERLREIYQRGDVQSSRLDAMGRLIPYSALNGAGYTLEGLLGIIPNGRSEPDFMGWEIKAHTGAAVTLMTPEPDRGTYLDDLGAFLQAYGKCDEARRDFTGRQINEQMSLKSRLTLRMEGYNPTSGEITDPSGGGFMLRDEAGTLAAGWSFNKLVTHWSRKHGQTVYVGYRRTNDHPYATYRYGPSITLCEGAHLRRFLDCLYRGVIYYDPGINQKWSGKGWVSKKRNQFRASWRRIDELYDSTSRMTLSDGSLRSAATW